jgi:hypothetical protein
MQSLITWNTPIASSVESSTWSNSCGSRAITFCPDFRKSLGAFPGSRVTVISPSMISSPSSSDLGVWLALCFLTGDPEEDFTAAGVEDRDALNALGVGASYVPLTSTVSSASDGEPSDSSFISLSAASTTSDFVSRVSSAIFVDFERAKGALGPWQDQSRDLLVRSRKKGDGIPNPFTLCNTLTSDSARNTRCY